MLKAIMRTLVVGALFVLVAGTGADRANAQSLNPAQMNALQAAVAAGDMDAIQSLTAQIVESDPMLHEAIGTALGGFIGSVPGAATNAAAIAEAMGKGVVQGGLAAGAENAEIASRVREAVYAMVLAAPGSLDLARIAASAVKGATEQADGSGVDGLTDLVAGQGVAGAIEAARAIGVDPNRFASQAVAAAVLAGATPQAVAVAALLAGASPESVREGLDLAGVPDPEFVVASAQNQIENNQQIGNEDEGDTSAT